MKPWPRCWAAPRACTPSALTKRWLAHATSAARSRATRSLILAEETGITKVVDPLGGSYYIEALTDALV